MNPAMLQYQQQMAAYQQQMAAYQQQQQLQQASTAASASPAAPGGAAGAAMPPNWTAVVDPTTKATYYFNSVTRQSQWTAPAAAAAGAGPVGPALPSAQQLAAARAANATPSPVHHPLALLPSWPLARPAWLSVFPSLHMPRHRFSPASQSPYLS